MNKFVKGYSKDAAVDIVMDKDLVIQPGFNSFELPAQYCPADGEVALLFSRGSTAAKGIMVIQALIDTGYTGKLSAWVFNCSGEKHEFKRGDRVFSIANFKLGEDRVPFVTMKTGERGDNKLASSGESVKRAKVILEVKALESLDTVEEGVELNEGYDYQVDGSIPQLADGIAKLAIEMDKDDALGNKAGGAFLALISQYYEATKGEVENAPKNN